MGLMLAVAASLVAAACCCFRVCGACVQPDCFTRSSSLHPISCLLSVGRAAEIIAALDGLAQRLEQGAELAGLDTAGDAAEQGQVGWMAAPDGQQR